MPCAKFGRSVSVLALIGTAWINAQVSGWKQKYDAGMAALQEGRYADARALLETAARSGDGATRGRAAYGLGSVCLSEGRFEEAERFFNEAKATLEPLGGPAVQLAVIWNGLGEVYLNQTRLDDAEKATRRAMSLFEGAPEVHPCMFLCRRHLAEICFMGQDYAGAKKLLKELIADERTFPNESKGMLGATLSVLARTYLMQNRLAEAEPVAKESMELQRQFGEQSPAYADSLVLMAGVYRLEHRLERAEPLPRKALKIYERIGDPRDVFAYRELGCESATEGKYLMARDYFEKALDTARKASMTERVTSTLEKDLVSVQPLVAGNRRR